MALNKDTSVWDLTAPLVFLRNPLNALLYTPEFFCNNHIAVLGDAPRALKKDDRFIEYLDDINRYQDYLALARKLKLEIIASSDSVYDLRRFDEKEAFDPFLNSLLKVHLFYSFMFDEEGSEAFNSLFERVQPHLHKKVVRIIGECSPDEAFGPITESIASFNDDRTEIKARKKKPYNTLKRFVDIIVGSNSKFANTHLTRQAISSLRSFLENSDGNLTFSREDLITLFQDRYALTLLGPGNLENANRYFVRNHRDIEVSRPIRSSTNDPHHQRIHIQAQSRLPEFKGVPIEILIKTEPDFIEGKLFYAKYKGVEMDPREKNLRESLVKRARKLSTYQARELLFDETRKLLI